MGRLQQHIPYRLHKHGVNLKTATSSVHTYISPSYHVNFSSHHSRVARPSFSKAKKLAASSPLHTAAWWPHSHRTPILSALTRIYVYERALELATTFLIDKVDRGFLHRELERTRYSTLLCPGVYIYIYMDTQRVERRQRRATRGRRREVTRRKMSRARGQQLVVEEEQEEEGEEGSYIPRAFSKTLFGPTVQCVQSRTISIAGSSFGRSLSLSSFFKNEWPRVRYRAPRARVPLLFSNRWYCFRRCTPPLPWRATSFRFMNGSFFDSRERERERW